jgi:hypothetical protein
VRHAIHAAKQAVRVQVVLVCLAACGLWTPPAGAQAPAAVPVFQITPGESTITFHVNASVTIEGTFDQWQASLTFTSPAVESAVLDVQIQAASVNTGSDLKNDTLKGKDFFNVVYYSFYTGSRKDGITMANVKTAISIQQSLFEQVEALARELHISRSRLFAIAVEDFMQRYENQRLLERINDAYADTTTPDEQALLRRMRRQQRQMVEGEW